MQVITKLKYSTCLGLVVIGGFLLILHWNTISLPLIRDEGEYAYAAWSLTHGLMPYANAFIQKPPMIIYTYCLAQFFGHGSWVSVRWLLLLFQFGSIILLGAIAYREIDRSAAWSSMLLLGPMLMMPQLEQFTANTEQFAMLPLLGLWFIYSMQKSKSTTKNWFVAGGIGMITLLYKYSLAPIVFYIFTVWVIESYNQHIKVGIIIRISAALAGAVSLAILILSIFIHYDYCATLYDCTIRFNKMYAVAHILNWDYFRLIMSSLVKVWWVLFILVILFFTQRPPRWWFYLGLIIAALISTTGSGYTHYYLPVMPILALLAAGGLSFIHRFLVTYCKSVPNLTLFVILVFTLLLVLYPSKKQLIMSKEEIEYTKYCNQPFSEAVLIAEKIAEKTTPEDSILVAGSEPEILYYAKRKSCTRFIIFYPLMLPTIVAKAYQIQAIQEIEKNPPRAIIFVNSNFSWLMNRASPKLIINFITSKLNDYMLYGGYKKTDNGGFWESRISTRADNSYSMFLFIRKESF